MAGREWDLWGRDAIAAHLGVSVNTLCEWRGRDAVLASRLRTTPTGRWYANSAELDAWMRGQAKATG